jgi:hypothetical protein
VTGYAAAYVEFNDVALYDGHFGVGATSLLHVPLAFHADTLATDCVKARFVRGGRMYAAF